MDEFFDYPDDETRQLTPGLNAPALLAITYHEDPDLKALKHMVNDGNSDVLKSAILNGRLKNDLWALGLPEAENIHRISISDTNSLYVEAVVTSKDRSSIKSMMERCKDSLQGTTIKSIVMLEKELGNHEIRPVTTLIDYHRRCQAPYLAMPPLLTYNNSGLIVNSQDTSQAPNGANAPVISLGISTPPITPQRDVRKKNDLISSHAMDHSEDEDSIRSEIEQTARADFELTLAERMAELQAGFNKEKRDLEAHADTIRTEFEEILAERLAEVQAEFNKKEKIYHDRIAQAERTVNSELSARLTCEESSSDASLDRLSSPVSEQDSGFDVKIAKKLAEFKDFAAAVDAKMNERRLEDMRRRMEETEEAQLKRRLESTLRDLRHHQYALSSMKERLADMEKQTYCPNCGNSCESPEGKDDCEMDVDMPNALQGMQCDDPAEPAGSQSPGVSCPSCDVKQRSLRLSKLHVQAMELRVSLSERRIFETENCTAWLVRALQTERRKRKDAEAALLVENQRRLDAEAGATAIFDESLFVVPAMFRMFLRFEGIISDIAGA